MKLFICTYWTNYGQYVEIIVAHDEKEAHTFVSEHAENEYDLEEVSILSTGNKLRCGGDGDLIQTY